MLTILEGPDGGGKSTFAAATTGRVETHGPYAGETELAQFYLASITRSLGTPRRAEHVLMDRSWLSEPIYGAACRGGADRVGVAHRRMLERCALAAGGVVALFLPPLERCAATWVERRHGEYLPDLEALARVHAAYARLSTALPVVRYDHTVGQHTELRDALDAARPPVNRGPGAGLFQPGITLLVGERTGAVGVGELARGVEAPFVSFSRAGCSAWLAEQLEEAGVQENTLYWVNAVRADGRATDAGFLDALEPAHIIALGAVATAWCHSLGLASYTSVPHPRSWKRFHHHERYPLLDLLEVSC